ncbi:MAG TPA: hypothetical protein VMG12_12185, partial [Polyangiaceae bacterium]|nr:hypothetical protein [Polyangiaceae bacterium]
SKRPRKLALELIGKLGAEAAVEALLCRLDAQGPCEPRLLSEVQVERAGKPPAPRPTWQNRGRDRAPRPGPARNTRGAPPRAQRR